MQKKITGTILLKRNIEAKTKYVIHIGGSRSSKSYSIAQHLALYCFQNTEKVISVIRKTLPALKATALRDFQEVLENLGVWDENSFNRTELIYKLNGNIVEFLSVDNPEKIRGRKRDIAWLNEANTLDIEDFRQVDIRTLGKEARIFMDLNPSDVSSWVYDLADQRPEDCTVIHSTYLDNHTLSGEDIRSIEAWRKTDPEFWKVYGLGLRGGTENLVFPKYNTFSEFPDNTNETFYGLDFGYMVPSALVECRFSDEAVYVKLHLYESHLNGAEIAERVKAIVGKSTVYADVAEPDKIAELRKLNVNAEGADKSVKAGIDAVKQRKLYIHRESTDLLREVQTYKWKTDRNGNRVDNEVVKMNDHATDAMRYAVYAYHKQRRSFGTFDYDFVVS